MTTFAVSSSAPHEVEADVLVVFASPGEPAPLLLGGLPEAPREALGRALALLRAQGKADEVTLVPAVDGVAAALVAVAGVGCAEPSAEQLRRAAGAAGRALAGRASAAVVLPDTDAPTLGAVVEGLGMGSYRYAGTHGSATAATAEKTPVQAVQLCWPTPAEAPAEAQDVVRRSEALVEGVTWARDLVNASPNQLYPATFAQRVRERAPEGLSVQVLDVAELEKQGCGGILGVGQGSVNPPAIVRLSYSPAGAGAKLAFVGKGITFDSGGLCLKTPTGMITMKCDMGGAAAVAAAVVTIARMGVGVAVEGWLCLAENMPDGRAQRPGDIVTMADGSTCEVINTDAEGRLVLADGLVLASREEPDAIVDVATLTGAAMIALGKRTAAVMANDDEFQGDVAAAATAAGESVWPMPIPEEMTKGLETPVADRKHASDREGGALFAAAFLREYVGGRGDTPIPWAHVDIAGPAYHEGSPYGYTPKGGTGFAVRTLVGLAESRA